MDMRLKKILKWVSIICILVIIAELAFLIYYKFIREEERTYFDGVNAYDYSDSVYVTVGSNNDNDKGYEKAKISKYNSKKEKIWERIYNKGYNSSFFGTAIDEGNFLAVGNYEANKSEKKNSVRTALFVKYDSKGNLIFEKRLQVLGNSKFTNVEVVDDGYIVVGQSIYENMTLGLSEDGGAFILKYSKDGKLLWKSNYGGGKSGVYNDVVAEGDYIYAVGKDYARVGIISKYDMDGNRLDTVSYKFTDTFGFTGVIINDGNIVVSGAKKISEENDDYDTDALIARYDLDLNYINEVLYVGEGIERYNQIISDSNDNLIVVGTTGIYDKNKSTKKKNVFSYDGIIGKYKNDLKEVDVLEYGDEKNDYFTDIKYVDDNYLVSGYSTYENNYLSKFITYSDALKVLEVS